MTEQSKPRFKVNEKAVRVFMAAMGIDTLEKLAEDAGITSMTLRRLFKGDMPFKSSTIESLARVLGCNPLDILIVDGYPDPHLGAPAFAAVS